MSIKVLSFNLLYGAGVERQFDSALPTSLIGVNRLPELLSYVKTADPDIWGIEEANGWDQGTPPVIEQVAKELGMHSVLAKTPSGFHLGLLTKFEIVESKDLSAQIGPQGVLRTLLRTQDGSELVVFLVHLEPNSQDVRLCEVNTLVKELQAYTGSRTILMGDMNFAPGTREHLQLEQAGWKPVAVEKAWGIDQIWISPAVDWSVTPWFPALTLPSGISDHSPIGAGINIYPGFVSVPTRAPISPTPMIQIPAWLSTELTGVRVTQQDGFDDSCSSAKWASSWKTERVSNGVLEITGEAPWQASVFRYENFLPGDGIVLRFQFSQGSEFEISFDNGLWNTNRYQRFAINLRPDAAQAVVWQGTAGMRGENLKGNLYPKPDTWYDLWLDLDRQGEFMAQMRDQDASSHVLKFLGRVSDEASGSSWTMRIGVDKGRLSIDKVTELALDK